MMKPGDVAYSEDNGLTLFIGKTDPKKCDLCGKIAELRPYGPNGENVCFECGMKDEKAAERAFSKRLIGIQTVAVIHKEAPDEND